MLKSALSYFLSVMFLSIIFCIIYWYAAPESHHTFSFTSPLPDSLTMSKNNQVRLLDFWFPEKGYARSSLDNITAKSVLMYDLTQDKVLFERSPQTRMPMASLTKIMTAIVAMENPKPDNRYIVNSANLVGEDSMGLEAGEIHPLEDLLYGLMLNSGNDAAEVLASNFPGGRDAFVKAMNSRAESLGLTDTHFSNPSGLQGDGVQYTTVNDLLVMTKYALETFPRFKQIVSTYEKEIPANGTHKEYHIFNETNLLTSYPGVKGVKTGYTPEAGMCLVTYLEYDGHQIIGVILNSENRRQEMKDLLDYSLTEEGVTPPAHE